MEYDNDIITCFEKWDYDKLNEIKNLPSLPKSVKIITDKIIIEKEEIYEGKLDYIRIHYSTKKGFKEGRVYGNIVVKSKTEEEKKEGEWKSGGSSLQGIHSWIKRMVCYPFYYDFDISNCAPTLLSQILKEYNLCPNELINYINNREALFIKYSEKLNISKDEVKKGFLSILHMGNSEYSFQIPEINKLKNSLFKSLELLSNVNDYYKNLYIESSITKRKNKKRKINKDIKINNNNKSYDNKMGRFCARVWQIKENLILMKIRNYFINIGYSPFNMVLCFDGIMIEKNNSLLLPNLNDLELFIKNETGFIINIKQKSLEPTIEDLSLFNLYNKK